MSLLHLYLLLPAAMLLAVVGFLLYDRLVCRPRCWRHGRRPDFSAIDERTWEAYFHVLPNALETLRRRGLPSPFADTFCAWRMDRFERRLARELRDEIKGRLTARDFQRCHRVLAFLVRFAFPSGLHHTACITRLRKALDEDRVEADRRALAREALLQHERRLGILTEVERNFGPPLPVESAEYFYGLMVRWQALFEEHGYTLHPDLASWRRERADLGI